MNTEQLRARVQELKQRLDQGHKMLDQVNREILLISGAFGEATHILNCTLEEEANALKAKEEAKKAKLKAKKGSTTDTEVSEVTEDTAVNDFANEDQLADQAA